MVNRLTRYANSEFSRSWDEDEATEAIVAFLGGFSIECLRTFERGTALPEIEADNQSEIYIVSKFLKDASSSDQDLFKDFMILVKGHMLANALLCPDLNSIEKNFKHVSFFVDTNLILSLLGLEDEASREATLELIRLIKVLQGDVAVFTHTLDELQSVVAAAASQVDSGNTLMPAALAARRQGLRPSDLLTMAQKGEDLVHGLGLTIRPTPRATRDFQISEAELQKAIEQEAHYGNPRALEYDINSIRSIYELRGGFQPRRLEDSRAVLLTSNTALARAAYEFGKSHSPGSAVSAVVTDFSLANIAWLKAPAEIPDFPETEVLAACYAAMEPDHATWTRYLQEIEKLERSGQISPDEHQVLRYSSVAREGLTDLTIGRDKALTSADLDELMKRVKRDMSRDAERQKAMALRELHIEKMRSQRMEEDARSVFSRLKSIAGFLGKLGRIAFLLLSAGLFFLISLITNGFLKRYAPHFSGVQTLVFITSILTALFWAFDLSPKGVGNKVGKIIEERSLAILRRVLDLRVGG